MSCRISSSIGLGVILAAGCSFPSRESELSSSAIVRDESALMPNLESWSGELLLYAGSGVAERAKAEMPGSFAQILPKASIRWISDRSLWSEPVSNSIFIMPGGADLPYLRELRGEPNLRIKNFVESGGSYIGFCAGAYYASSEVQFDEGGPLEVVGQRELALFPGIARGPLYRRYSYKDDEGAAVATLKWCLPETEPIPELKVYFNGGCEFVAAARYPEVTVLARYADLPGEPAAIIECRVGKGRALLSGVHPELDLSTASLKCAGAAEIQSELMAHSAGQRWLLQKLLERSLGAN